MLTFDFCDVFFCMNRDDACRTVQGSRKVDVRLPGKGNSNSHGARPVHLIITMIKWIRTSRLSVKNSLSEEREAGPAPRDTFRGTSLIRNNHFRG